VYGQISIGLKIFYSFLPSQKGSNFFFKGRDFLDLSFKDFDFASKKIITILLIGNHRLKPPINSRSNGKAYQC